MSTIDPSAVARPAAWRLDLPYFRGANGPFSPLKAIAEHVEGEGAGSPSHAGALARTLGEHPHCVAGPVAPPHEVVELRRISIQPDQDSIESCLDWFTVDLYLTEAGRIEGVTYDVWEP